MKRKTAFDISKSHCTWQALNEANTGSASDYSCTFTENALTLKTVIYVSIIVSIIASMCMHPIDVLFDLLLAPLAGNTFAVSCILIHCTLIHGYTYTLVHLCISVFPHF